MHPKGTCPFGRAHSHAGAWERVGSVNRPYKISMKIYIRVYEPYESPETQEYSSNVYESD